MLLTIGNLPHHMRYTDIKTLISQKCGIRDLILDNLVIDSGNTKKVTVGVASEGDADNLMRKINGIYVEGQQLYVEESRKKKASSKQYNSGQSNSANTSNMAMTPDQYNMMMQSYSMMQGMYMMPTMNDQQQNYSMQGQAPPYMQNFTPEGAFDANYPSAQWGQQQYGGYGSHNSGQRPQGNHEAKSQQQQNYTQDRSWNDGQRTNTSGLGNSSFNTNSRYEQNNQQYGQNSSGKRKYPDSQDNFQDQQIYRRRGEQGNSSNAQRNQSQYQSNQQYDNYDGANSNGNRKHGNQEGRYQDDRNQNSRNDRTWRSDQGNSHNHQEKRSRFEPANNQYGGNYSGYSTQNSRGGFGPNNDIASSKAGKAPNDFDSWNATQGSSFSYERSEEKRNYNADLNRPSSFKSGQGFGNKRSEGNWNDAPPRAGNQHNDGPIPKIAKFNETANPEPPKNQKKKKKINIFKTGKPGPNRIIPEKARTGTMFTKVNHVTFMCQGASFLQREIVSKHSNLVHKKAVKLIKKKVRARIFNIIEAEQLCIRSREDAVQAYRMKYPCERDWNLVMSMNAQVGQGAPAPDGKPKQQNPAVPKKEPVTPCKPNIGQSSSDFIPLNMNAQNTNAENKLVPNPLAHNTVPNALAHNSSPQNPSAQNSAKKNKKKKKGKQVEIKIENTYQRRNLPRYPNGSKATLCEMKRIGKLEMEEDIYELPPLLEAAFNQEMDAIAEMITEVVKAESEKLAKPSRVIQHLECSHGKKDIMKFIKLHTKRRIVNATSNLAVGINYNGGKPVKEKLEALMRQYGAMTLKKSKLRKMHMAQFDNFDDYDRLLKLGSCVMDNVQVVFKPMHLIGPRSKSHLSEKQKAALHAKFNFGLKEEVSNEQPEDFTLGDDVYDLIEDENVEYTEDEHAEFTDDQLDAIAREECENYAKIMQGASADNAQGETAGISQGETAGISQGETAGISQGETAGTSQGETAGNSQGETAKDVTDTTLNKTDDAQEVIKSVSQSNEDTAKNVQAADSIKLNDAASAGENSQVAVNKSDNNMHDSDVEEVILDSTVVEIIEDDAIDEINMDDVDENDLVDYL